MAMKFKQLVAPLMLVNKSRLAKNSFWGIAASGGQTLLLSLFFVILARRYEPSTFALFLIATTIYQLFSAFSTLGLSQWFTRTLVGTENRADIINTFLKVQLISGIIFYVVNIAVAYSMYQDTLIRHLAVILGVNIIFDNIIYGLQALNVAEFKQKKNFTILFIDSILKFLASCILFIYPLPIIAFAIILICIRLTTVNIFLKIGSSDVPSFRKLIAYKISWKEIKSIVVANWTFVIIGSISIIYWRIGNLIVSKTLPLMDVANYEIAYKILSLALVLPIIVSSTVFPSLVEMRKAGNMERLMKYFHRVFLIYLGYSVLVYTFFFSFSDVIIPYTFGEKFAGNVIYTKQMFLAILVFPTVLLQANVLIAIHKEKVDMWLNAISLVLNVLICIGGLYFYKSLTVVNLAIFTSFLVFHICQDVYLVRNKITTTAKVIKMYALMGAVVGSYVILSKYLQPVFLFCMFWSFIGLLVVGNLVKYNKETKRYTFKPHLFS